MKQTAKDKRALYDALADWRGDGPIRTYREKAGLNVTDFAALVGCTFANVTYWEEQGGYPKKHLDAVAKVMGIHPTTLQARVKKWREYRP